MDYILHILILIGIYTILTCSLDLLVGHTGLIAISQAAFYGIGAYASAILSVQMQLPFWLGLFCGMLVAAIVSLAVSVPSVWLRGDYFVMATFGFQIITFNVFNNWESLTHGPLGIMGIPVPTIFGYAISSTSTYLVLVASFAVVAVLFTREIANSPFGRVLRAIREDETFAQSLGKNTVRCKITIFAVSASLAAVAGSLYAQYTTYIDPTSFTLSESILVIAMVIIGGAGSVWGSLIGAVSLTVLPEVLRLIGIPGSLAENIRQGLYGVILVALMAFRPRGLVGKYSIWRSS